MAKQLTIFVENRPGRLQSIAENLRKNNIDIRAFTIQDRGDYGLLRLIVDKPSEAYLAMADVGCACALKDVLAVSVPDQPGNFLQADRRAGRQRHQRARRLRVRPATAPDRHLLHGGRQAADGESGGGRPAGGFRRPGRRGTLRPVRPAGHASRTFADCEGSCHENDDAGCLHGRGRGGPVLLLPRRVARQSSRRSHANRRSEPLPPPQFEWPQDKAGRCEPVVRRCPGEPGGCRHAAAGLLRREGDVLCVRRAHARAARRLEGRARQPATRSAITRCATRARAISRSRKERRWRTARSSRWRRSWTRRTPRSRSCWACAL